MDARPYHQHVRDLENHLGAFAQRSFDPDSPVFIDGTTIEAHFQGLWQSEHGQRKIANRTPLQLERDRILYSNALRKQTEKFHTLYGVAKRITRNYTTETMRTAQVSRSICSALRLNADFAEAIALGSKVGAAPFIHRTKHIACKWLVERLEEIKKGQEDATSRTISAFELLGLPADIPKPNWLAKMGSDLIDSAVKYIPSALGANVDYAYTSGAESYWLLCTDPFLRESSHGKYRPETMFGIWRHSRVYRPARDSFFHLCAFYDAVADRTIQHTITWHHATFESVVVQFADDITWIIENLSDAALLEDSPSRLFRQFRKWLGETAPVGFTQPLDDSDAGGLYTYFISDFIDSSRKTLTDTAGPELRAKLREGEEDARIGLSPEAANMLEKMRTFLDEVVFRTPRIHNRNLVLDNISKIALDLLYGKQSPLERFIDSHSDAEDWTDVERERARKLLRNDVHRAQLALDVYASLGDQEVFELIGLERI